MIYYSMLFMMTLLGSAASIFLKRASGEISVFRMVFNRNILIGGFLYFLSAVLNIYLLRHLEYSVVLPLTAVTYIWTLVFSSVFLKEKITKKKVWGIIFIMIGIAFIAH